MLPNNIPLWFFYAALLLLFPSKSTSQGIINTSGAQVVASSTVKIVLNNSGFTNNGIFTQGNSEVVFTGSVATANSFIGGSSNTSFYNLTLRKSANGIQLNRNIDVTNTLLFTSGDSLFLNAYNIDLGSTGNLSGETGSRRITGRAGGYIQSTQLLNVPTGANPGNLGINISCASNLGNTVIRRGHQQQSGASVYRFYDVTPTNNAGLDATIIINYFDAELAGISEGNLGMFYSTNGGTSWANLGVDAIDHSLNYLSVNGIDQLALFTLANISQPLAIKLLYLKAVFINGKVQLDWATENESNSSHFEIERSMDGRNFTKIGEVDSRGNSIVLQHYKFADLYPVIGKNFYRLRQVDIDGHAEYSYMVLIQKGEKKTGFTYLYPNPVKVGPVKIIFRVEQPAHYLFQVFDMEGKLMLTKQVYCIAGINEIGLDVSILPGGVFNVRINNGAFKTIQFVK